MLNYLLYSLLILNSYFNHEYLSISRKKSRFLITINLKFVKLMTIVQHDIIYTFKHWSNTIFRASSLPEVGSLNKTPQASRFTRNGARLILCLVIAYTVGNTVLGSGYLRSIFEKCNIFPGKVVFKDNSGLQSRLVVSNL